MSTKYSCHDFTEKKMKCAVESVQRGEKWLARIPRNNNHHYGRVEDEGPRDGFPHYSLDQLNREKKYHHSVTRERERAEAPRTPSDGMIQSPDGSGVRLRQSCRRLGGEKKVHEAELASSPSFLRRVEPEEEAIRHDTVHDGPQTSQRAFTRLKAYHETDYRASPRRFEAGGGCSTPRGGSASPRNPAKYVPSPSTSQKMLARDKRSCLRGLGGPSSTVTL